MDIQTPRGSRLAAIIDRHVGDRIRRRRVLMGYTQEQLADALEISYQQIQKYETGANRVSAGRLFQIAQRLETTVGYFFEGLERGGYSSDPIGANARPTIELVRNFNAIQNPSTRAAVAQLVRAVSGADMGEDQFQADAADTDGGQQGD